MNAKNEIGKMIEMKKKTFTTLSDEIWETPELRFNVTKSVENYYPILVEEGFSVEKGIADMEDAFIATYGKGYPVIGILAEYDALDNLSQVADSDKKEPIISGGNGHGCGHNLLGAGALAGAVGIKDYMEKHNMQGTVKLFGCPAEESGYGKAFMARDGIFDCLDAAVSWHPMDFTAAWSETSLAVQQAYFKFKGKSSHAALAPSQGRSALDAAELMNIGVQFLREHIMDGARIHYAFTDAGGQSANVVQSSAELHYFVRAPKVNQTSDIFDRVVRVAEGAAKMTDTELEIEFDSACANYIPNKAITTAMNKNINVIGNLELTEMDQAYASRYYEGLSEAEKAGLLIRAKALFVGSDSEEIEKLAKSPVLTKTFPLVFSERASGSSDVGDVSWVVPTAQVLIGCEPQGTPPHSWQWVANGKSDVAHKGLLAAGKVIAATVYDLLSEPELLELAKEEHKKTLDGKVYKSAIPEFKKPK